MAKKTTKRVTRNESFNQTCQGIISSSVGVFLFISFLLFPLFYDNYYFNILETKWRFYCRCAIGILGVSIFLGLIFLFVDITEFKGESTQRLLARMKLSNWKQTFTIADLGVLLFLIICVISTLQSDYKLEAFTGLEGRRTGLALTFLYVSVYFLISRCWKMKNWLMEIFLVSGVLVCFLGIGDYFQLDWLGFHEKIAEQHRHIYVSTIGNINTYTAYVALVMGFAAAMYISSDKVGKTVWYYIAMVISFFAIIMGCSDNAYLALGTLFGFMPLLVFNRFKGICRYFIIVATFFTVVLCIDFLNTRFASMVIGLDSLFGVIASQKGLVFGVYILWLVAAGFFYWEKKQPDAEFVSKRIPLYAWCVVLAVTTLAISFVLFDVNVAENTERYGALTGYLQWNDNWGTNRGYIWRKSWETFCEFPFVKKMIGYGPDTFRFVTKEFFYDEMIAVTGQQFDSVHNEYLQYLVTIGGLGLLGYLVFLVSLGRQMLKAAIGNPYEAGIFMAVLCYLVQAIVNINLPIVTPMVWLLFGCGGAAYRCCVKVDESGGVF